ncbi:MAG: hypothetical protein HYY52_08940 [Candidatus Melainabacteria bacterium]|nr:hypothetical protein [Candidatus Melainabacteria bacterium]
MKKINLIIGDDLNSTNEHVNKLLAEATLEKYELNNLEDFEKYLSSGLNLSLFPENTIQVISLSNKVLKHIEKEDSGFVNLIKRISFYKQIVIVLAFDKKQIVDSNFINQIKPVANIVECTKLKYWQTAQIKEKIKQIGSELNLKFEESALTLITDYYKDKLDNLRSDIQKLQLYLLPDNKVSEKNIKELFSGVFNIEDLYKSIILHKDKEIFSLLNNIKQAHPVLYIIASLQNKLRQALKIRISLDEKLNKNQIAKVLGINLYKLEKEIVTLKNISTTYLKNIVSKLSEIEYKLKSGIINDSHALELFVLGNSTI